MSSTDSPNSFLSAATKQTTTTFVEFHSVTALVANNFTADDTKINIERSS
jgi:hypothetical protein